MFIDKKLIVLFLFINIFYVQAGERQNTPSQARLISSFKRVQPGHSIDIGVYITLKKGWHTYWKNLEILGKASAGLKTLPFPCLLLFGLSRKKSSLKGG